MNNRKQKAVISILAVLLCLSLGIGLTYAFFTDVVKNKGNNIMSGEIDVELELLHESGNWYPVSDAIFQEGQDNEDDEDDDYYDDEEENYVGIFHYDNWEPGFTEVKLLRVANNGDFALEWRARIILHEAMSELANVIDVYIKTGDTQFAPLQKTDFTALAYGESTADGWKKVGTFAEFIKTVQNDLNGTLLAGEYDYFGIALHMQESAGNEYQELSINNFELKIEAIQQSHESDALGSDYDETPEFSKPEDDLVFTHHVDPETGEEYYSVSSYFGPFTGWDDTNASEYWREMHFQNVVIPDTYQGLPVKEIDSYAFYERNILSVVIPDSITKINRGAFLGCELLTKIEIPDSVTTIEVQTFESCYGLQEVIIPDSVTVIEECAFFNCTSLRTIDLPDGLKTIGGRAFSYCYSLEEIVIPDSVTSLDTSDLFSSCYSLESVTLPSNLTTIGDWMFYDCDNLKTLNIPASVTSIGRAAFAHSGIREIELHNGITQIGYGAFQQCDFLKEITIPGSVKNIGDYEYTFSSCYRLEKVIFEDGVESIGSGAFGDCDNLKEFVLPHTVTTIAYDAFPICYPWYDTDYFYTHEITYNGTSDQWNASGLSAQLHPSEYYESTRNAYIIHCVEDDVTITLAGSGSSY